MTVQAAMFSDQFAAKAFFVDRVIAQAKSDGVSLLRAETNQLAWAEVEGDFLSDAALGRVIGPKKPWWQFW